MEEGQSVRVKIYRHLTTAPNANETGTSMVGLRFDDEDDEIFFLKYMDMNTEELKEVGGRMMLLL